MIFERLCIIGVGLIGGSLSLALKQAGQVGEVVGYARTAETRQQALDLGIIDVAADTLAEAVRDADGIFIAVPMGAMESVLADIAPHISDKVVMTDGGSVKTPVVKAAYAELGDKVQRFVPGHPIAGTEKSGPNSAFATLYQQHQVILTLLTDTADDAVVTVRAMWEAVGAVVTEMDPTQHDAVLAATSHLPHVLAFNLVDVLAQHDDCQKVLRYAAGGFRDFSRIASSDPVMWRDICISNRDAMLALLTEYRAGLETISAAIASGDEDYLLSVFERAKAARDTRFTE
jgi:prephenate dehydrogenase